MLVEEMPKDASISWYQLTHVCSMFSETTAVFRGPSRNSSLNDHRPQSNSLNQVFTVRVCLKMANFPMNVSDTIWQQQKYARPEIYVVTNVLKRADIAW